MVRNALFMVIFRILCLVIEIMFCYDDFTPSVPSLMLVNHVICLHCLVAIVQIELFFVNILIVVQ